MANLTLAIDDDLLKRARLRAVEQGTSVNAVLRDYLKTYAMPEQLNQAVAELLVLSENATSSSGPEGRTWTRDELYDR